MNPDAPKFLPMCCNCNREINGGWKYTCNQCEDEYSMCPVRTPHWHTAQAVEGQRASDFRADHTRVLGPGLSDEQGCYQEGYWRNHLHPLQRMPIRSKAAESNEPDMLRQKE